MKKKQKLILFILFSLGLSLLFLRFLYDNDIAVLNPKGLIALREKELIITTTLLMLLVVIPVFILTVFITWKYREDNTHNVKYDPDWDYNFIIESIWWGIPGAIVIALAIITWISCHELDPFKPLNHSKPPITIQVVALQWKWLFIYPKQKIATLNYFQIPENTPINFEITADAPMNSFWIPQLGGQMYAMPGMNAKLHLIATELGSFAGSSANLSGRGFSGMRFIATASSQSDFDQWVSSIQHSKNVLNINEYQKLVEPTENHAVSSYSLHAENLYDWILMKYMMPMTHMQELE